MIDTFLRYAASSLRWAQGERAHRLTSVLAGLLPDMLAEAARQVARWSLPLAETPADVLPYLLRFTGLPQYEEGYFVTLARLRVYLETHAVSGARAQIVAEAAACGYNSPGVEQDTGSSFWITSPDVGAGVVLFGDGTKYGAPVVYGYQSTATNNEAARRNLFRAMRHFKPARERFNGVKAP